MTNCPIDLWNGLMAEEDYIERRIVTGLIVSDNYARRIKPFWRPDYIESPEIKRIASWCWEYFDKYGKTPDSDIESIYVTKKESGLIPKAELELIEIILDRASRDFGRGEQFSAAYIYDQTIKYFKKRELKAFTERVQELLEQNKTEEAERLQQSFRTSSFAFSGGVTVGSELSDQMIDELFSKETQSVAQFPSALGEMLNEHLVRGGFVAFLAPEKRGKTFLLIELAIRALQWGKSNVAFFAAGDMTERQLLGRIAMRLAKRNMQERYCGEHWVPVGDCVLNQIDKCDRPERTCSFGVYRAKTLKRWTEQKENLEAYENLVNLAQSHPDYVPCNSRECPKRCGTVWLKKEPARPVLTKERAKEVTNEFRRKCKRILRIKSYDTGTLTPAEILSQLDAWEREDGFVPDVVIVDYADIMNSPNSEFRHAQNEIWMGLRAISINRDCLVVTATQANAASYTAEKLRLQNFSEDKRKYAHVTAMWALNQDPYGREKKLGILRIGELLVREGEFSPSSEVTVLQDLWVGRPYLESYWTNFRTRDEED